MKRLQLFMISAALVAGLSVTAAADVVITMTKTDLGSKKPTSTSGSLSMGSDRLTMRWEGGGDEEMSHVCFRGDRQVLWVLDDGDKSYMEITKEELDAVGEQVGSAMEKMKAELEKMPPEQRKMVEGMMKNNPALGGDVKKPERTIKRTSETKTINGFPCTKYEVYVDGAHDSDVWSTPFSKTGLKASDFGVFKQFMQFMDGLMSQFRSMKGKSGSSLTADFDAIDGVPIRTVDYDGDGKPETETLFDSVSRGDVAAGSYDLPKGYKKKEMFKKSK